MKNMFKLSAAVLAIFGAVGCGPLNSGSTASQVGALVVDTVTGSKDEPAPSSSVSQEEILSSTGRYIRVNIRNRDRWDTSVQAGSNSNRSTWIDSDNISLTFENGIVVATRGLPGDLMAADVSRVWATIQKGGGDAQRTHEFLTNNDGISTELLQCRIVSAGSETVSRLGTSQNARRFDESCESEGLQFANVYWVNSVGRMVRSLQAISPQAGYLQIDMF